MSYDRYQGFSMHGPMGNQHTSELRDRPTESTREYWSLQQPSPHKSVAPTNSTVATMGFEPTTITTTQHRGFLKVMGESGLPRRDVKVLIYTPPPDYQNCNPDLSGDPPPPTASSHTHTHPSISATCRSTSKINMTFESYCRALGRSWSTHKKW